MDDRQAEESPRALFDIGIQVLGATAGIAAVVYLIGAAIMWVRLHSLGFPAERVVSVIPRETILAVGILNLLLFGSVVLLVLGLALILYYGAWPKALDYLANEENKRTRARRSVDWLHLGTFVDKANQSRETLRLDSGAPGEEPRKVRLPGPAVPKTLIWAILTLSGLAVVVAAFSSSSWQLLVAAAIGLPIVILLLTENRRRIRRFGVVSEDEPSAEEVKRLHQASIDLEAATRDVKRLEPKLRGLEASLANTDEGDNEHVVSGLKSQIKQDTAELEAARERMQENKVAHHAYLAWDQKRAARELASRKPHTGLRFVQILAVTIYSGLFGLAYVADQGRVPVEDAKVTIPVKGADGRASRATLKGILVAQTSEGVHLGLNNGSLLFIPKSRVNELRTEEADRATGPAPASVVDAIGAPRLMERAVLVGAALLVIGWVAWLAFAFGREPAAERGATIG